MSDHSSQNAFNKLPENCFYEDHRVGEIDQIIQKFNKFEVPFFDYHKNSEDIKYWDFIRYDIIRAICVEKGLYGNDQICKKNILLRIPNIIKIFRNLIISLKNLFYLDLNEINYLSISSRRFNNLFNHNDHKNSKTLFIGKDSSNYKNIIYKDSVERLINIIS